jgi:3-dehydroquinate synthase
VSAIRKAGLPVGGLRVDPSEVFNAMAFDKKVSGGKVRFVLPDRIGHVVIRDDVPAERVREAIDTLRGEPA